MSRTVNLLGKKVSLIPLITALVIGSIVIGYATNDFLTLIIHPVQQTTYHREDTITIGDIPEYIEASVTLEGEVNGANEFVLNRPISVGLVITSLRPDFRVSDNYTLMIGEDPVLTGSMVDVEPGADHTDAGSWTPSTVGPAAVALDITGMTWTQILYASFTELQFSSEPARLGLVSNTLTVGTGIEIGTSVTFDYTVENIDLDAWIYGFLWKLETMPEGGSAWTEAARGKEWTTVTDESLEPGEMGTFTIGFTVPGEEGTYDIRLSLLQVRKLSEEEPSW